MKKIIYLFALVAMMFSMSTGVKAQSNTWDFLYADETDLENISLMDSRMLPKKATSVLTSRTSACGLPQVL